LEQHESVGQAVVIARETGSGDKHLVAYVIPAQAEALSSRELREALSARLPDYMIPTAFVVLSTLPLTPAGKVDRRALPGPEWEQMGRAEVFVAPSTDMEQQLAAIWGKLLGVDRVSVHDDFFRLGGHSLLAVQLVDRVQKAFHIQLPLSLLFQYPTIAKLIPHLYEDKPSSSYLPNLITLQPRGTKAPLFWVHGSKSYSSLAAYLDRPVYGLVSQTQDGPLALPESVEAMAANYLLQLRKVQPAGPYILGGYSLGGMVAFEMVRQLSTRHEEVALLALLDPTAPIHKRGLPQKPTGSIRKMWRLRSGISAELARQWRNLTSYTMQEKVTYIGLRIFNHFLRRIKIVTGKILVALGCSLPNSLRGVYLEQLYVQVASAYTALPVHCRKVILFQSEDNWAPHPFDWQSVIQGTLQIYKLTADHSEIVKPEHISVWAIPLREHLDKLKE